MATSRWLTVGLVGWVLSGGGAWAFTPSGLLEIHYIDVQQGGSTLLIGPDGTTVLMDSGNNGKGATEVVPYLQSLGLDPVDGLDYTLASHLDSDHIGGFDEVFAAGYDVHLRNWFNGSPKTGTRIDEYKAAAAVTSAGAPAAIPLGEVIELGAGARVTVVATNGEVWMHGPVPGAQADENDRSIAVLVEYGDFDFLWAGDLGGGDEDAACTGRSTGQANVETALAEALVPGGVLSLLPAEGVDVLHVNHHGSESSTNSDWMNLLRPEVAVISVGAGQSPSFQHPRKDVVGGVLLAHAPCITAPAAELVLETEEGQPIGPDTSTLGYAVGDIEISTDGVKGYWIEATGEVGQGPDERLGAGLPMLHDFDELGDGSGGAECTADATTLCLNGGRFRVTAHWSTPQGTSGAGQAQPLTPDTGWFWFFGPANVEVVVKVLDGCAVNDHFWVFAGGLTNVEVELTVEDTATPGAVRTYRNPQGTPFQPIQDTAAFATCDGGGNLAPTAALSWHCRGFTCAFEDDSFDTDGELVSRSWNLGDGTTLTWHFVTSFEHHYSRQGTFPVSLEVVDDGGLSAMASGDVDVRCIPSFACCKVCTTGRACGDGCISASFSCHQPSGCACDSREVC